MTEIKTERIGSENFVLTRRVSSSVWVISSHGAPGVELAKYDHLSGGFTSGCIGLTKSDQQEIVQAVSAHLNSQALGNY